MTGSYVWNNSAGKITNKHLGYDHSKTHAKAQVPTTPCVCVFPLRAMLPFSREGGEKNREIQSSFVAFCSSVLTNKKKTKNVWEGGNRCVDAFTMIQTFYTNGVTLVQNVPREGEKNKQKRKNINKAVKSGV